MYILMILALALLSLRTGEETRMSLSAYVKLVLLIVFLVLFVRERSLTTSHVSTGTHLI